MARPREFDVDEALDAAMQVFWEKGYQGSSLSELLKAMKIARGSLYKAFKDKRSIYLLALERYEQKIVDDALAALEDQSNGTLIERVRNLLMRAVIAVEDTGDRRGCLLCNAAVDLLPGDPETRGIVYQMVHKIEIALDRVITSYGSDNGWSVNKCERLALMINTNYMGLRMMAKAGYSSEQLRKIIDETLNVLK